MGFEWADNFRGERIKEVLSQDKKFTLVEIGALQNDYLSLPARQLLPYLTDLYFENEKVDSLRKALLSWDFNLNPESIEAGIYVMWERILRKKALELAAPDEVRDLIGSIPMTRVI
ncbi:MAG TPA: penicillin acylase family protein, partial [Algoriphagus sp.]|nr:penicillin acylase family protein [Algoriphagus sp.]